MSTANTKAKSRLSNTNSIGNESRSPRLDTKPLRSSKKRFPFKLSLTVPHVSGFTSRVELTDLGKRYLVAIPTLAIGLLFFLLLFYIFITVSPSNIANVLIYQSYFPVISLFCLGTFFVSTFIFLNKQKGAAFASWLTLLFFLELQGFIIDLPFVLGTATITAILYYLWSVLFNR